LPFSKQAVILTGKTNVDDNNCKQNTSSDIHKRKLRTLTSKETNKSQAITSAGKTDVDGSDCKQNTRSDIHKGEHSTWTSKEATHSWQEERPPRQLPPPPPPPPPTVRTKPSVTDTGYTMPAAMGRSIPNANGSTYLPEAEILASLGSKPKTPPPSAAPQVTTVTTVSTKDRVADAIAKLHTELRMLRTTEKLQSKDAIPNMAQRIIRVHIPMLGYVQVFKSLATTFNASWNVENSEPFRKALMYVCHETFDLSLQCAMPEALVHGRDDFFLKIDGMVSRVSERERGSYRKLLSVWEQRSFLEPSIIAHLRKTWKLSDNV